MRFRGVPPGMGYYSEPPEGYGGYGYYSEPPELYGYYGEPQEPYGYYAPPVNGYGYYGAFSGPYGEIEPGYNEYEPISYYAEEPAMGYYSEYEPMGYYGYYGQPVQGYAEVPPEGYAEYEPMGYYGQMPEMPGYGEYEPLAEAYPEMAGYGNSGYAGYVRDTKPRFNAGCPMPSNVSGFGETDGFEGYVKPSTVNPVCGEFTPQPGQEAAAPESFKPLW